MNFDTIQKPNFSRHSGLFTESRLTEILKAKGFGNIDKFSPFLGALVSFYRGQSSWADIARKLTKYVQLIRTFRKVNVRKCRAKRELQILTEMISDFKDRRCETFGKYQSSELA